MSWKRKTIKVLAVVAILALMLLLFIQRSTEDISCLYTTF